MLSAFLSSVAVFVAETAIAVSGAPAATPAAPLPSPVSTPLSTLDVAAPFPGVTLVADEVAATASRVADTTPVERGPVETGKAPAFADVSDAEIVAQVINYLEGISTLKGDFVQTAPTGAVVSGDFYLRRPGQIRFDYDDPSPITIVATGGLVYVENSELETTDSYPLKKTPLKFLLSKKVDTGDAVLKSVERNSDSLALTYASSDDETEGEITMIFAAPTLQIEQWSVTDPQGGVTIVSLQGVTGGGKLDNRLFRAPEAGGAFINR